MIIKTIEQIKKIREASQACVKTLDYIQSFIKAGMTTNELDKLCYEYITKELQCTPAYLNYQPLGSDLIYPKTICTSVNYQVSNVIPSDKKLKNGDIFNLDLSIMKDGFYGGVNRMFMIGKCPNYAQNICKVSYECLEKGLNVIKAGATIGDIGYAIQTHAEKNQFNVVRELSGYSTGLNLHEDPLIPNFGQKNTGIELLEGMVFILQPILVIGKPIIKYLPDGWGIVTKDRSLSAQWKHTILVTQNGFEILSNA